MASRLAFTQTPRVVRLYRLTPLLNLPLITQSLISPFFIRHQSITKMADRTYESALQHLDSIQSNRHITSLFTPPPPSSSLSSSSKPTPQDLNAQAIPEMLQWLSRAGITQENISHHLRCIHVAGTKGKGSVCAYLTSILLTQPTVAGRVGTYTSPHLVTVRERIQLDGQPISRPLFARYFFEVWDALTQSARAEAAANGKEISEEELQGPATKPFYFRFLTILAFHVFIRENVRSAVVECGIGGEYDSTNVLPADAVTAAVIARLDVDHVGMLGATVPEIAWHKAGIYKQGRKCYALGDSDDAVMRVLQDRAAEKKAVLVEVKEDLKQVEHKDGRLENGTLGGNFQLNNQALAIRAANEHLRRLEQEANLNSSSQSPAEEPPLETLTTRFTPALHTAHLRGRCEVLEDHDGTTWFIDGAHTAQSMNETGAWFAAQSQQLPHGSKQVLLFNQQERDVANLLDRLHAGIGASISFDCAVFTRNDLHPLAAGEAARDLSVQRVAAEAMRGRLEEKEIVVVDNVGDALERIRKMQRESNGKVAVLATGSLHLVGALLKTLEPDAEL